MHVTTYSHHASRPYAHHGTSQPKHASMAFSGPTLKYVRRRAPSQTSWKSQTSHAIYIPKALAPVAIMLDHKPLHASTRQPLHATAHVEI